MIITLVSDVRYDGAADPSHYILTSVDGVPLSVIQADPQVDILQTGVTGSPGPQDSGSFGTHALILPGAGFDGSHLGQYVEVTGPVGATNIGYRGRIVGVTDSTHIVLDLPLAALDLAVGTLEWQHTTDVKRIDLTTSRSTRGATYVVNCHLTNLSGSPSVQEISVVSTTALPQVVSATFLPEGEVLLTFDTEMRQDTALLDSVNYGITGPSTITITEVMSVSPSQVLLRTLGFEFGSYTVTVNLTPKDIAGNSIDPALNFAAFAADVPLSARSIFTNRGPIAKPPLTIDLGSTASIVSVDEVSCPSGSFASWMVGLYLTLAGINGGTYRVTERISSIRLRLRASFSLPDPGNGSLVWTLFDPRDGQIADDPADVTVRINGTPVIPIAVIGLLGQIVLESVPDPTDTVEVDYSWIQNPTVEVRRLNSPEFTLNNVHRAKLRRQYPYRSVLTSNFTTESILATLPQPEVRDLFYRAFERLYTASLNDPSTLLLNTPNHKIAFPPLSRPLDATSVGYSADTLPENDPLSPWVREGTGLATLSGGNLTLTDTTSGPFPGGRPIFWTRPVDLTFPHVFAATWRMQIDQGTLIPDGVWTGLAVGWSNDKKAAIVGFLVDSGTNKIGVLRAGGDPSLLSSWSGGFDALGVPTGLPVDFDWSLLHSYRIYRDRAGTVRVFVDGNVFESLRVVEADLPALEEVNDPFRQIQGVFWGSLSREAQNTSQWDFVRYLVLPTNPSQSMPSSFVDWEGDVLPEADVKSWTPVGYHGTETLIAPDLLLVDSTSVTDATTEDLAGLVGGDFRGFVRMEPLLTISTDVVLDVGVQVRTWTHGITPNACMVAIDDGDRLTQLSFLSSDAAPKMSYGGRSLPQDTMPIAWTPIGGGTATMVGRTLRITDTSTSDGLVYFQDDVGPSGDPSRVLSPTTNYILEFRCRVVETTPDGSGFAGVTADTFDGSPLVAGRALGVMFRQVSGVHYVTLHSDGVVVDQWAFNWDDGIPHTYRLVKTQASPNPVLTLFVDGALLGVSDYTLFGSPSLGPGMVSWGSSTATSNLARSVVDWMYVNAWRVLDSTSKWVGLWKGTHGDSLLGYHLPVKVPFKGGDVAGNVLHDTTGDFLARGVVAGDPLIIDEGPNQGVYTIDAVPDGVHVTILGVFPSGPTLVSYRVPLQTDWTTLHKYRIVRTPGEVAVLLDSISSPIISVAYNQLELPGSSVGVPHTINGNISSIIWGAFDFQQLSQTAWDFVRYGVTRSSTELRIVPPHQVLNQRNLISSPEHLTTSIAHQHTDFWSSNTGIPPRSLYEDPSLQAFTRLNEGTPLVPSTQSWEVRRPTPVTEFLSGLNRPGDVLNNDGGFVLNDARTRVRLLIPDDVLYRDLDVIERVDGSPDLIQPFADMGGPTAMTGEYTKEVCLQYTPVVLPELDTSGTPWVLASDTPSLVTTGVSSGVLTYQTTGAGTRTIYRNSTPLPDSSLETEVTFRLKLLQDGTGGTGDTGVRYGFSALGLTAAIAWVTDILGNRFVDFLDLHNGNLLARIPFDFNDGLFHTYRFVKDPSVGMIHFYIDG